MASLSLRRSFVMFHLVLGLIILMKSLNTVLNVVQGHTTNALGSHLALLALVEAVAAVLFLIPKTLKAGAWALIVVFLVAMAVHGIQHELDLLVFAAGVMFIRVHGAAYSRGLLWSRQTGG
ncbi:MAG: hypothetical protein WBD36_10030 [Bacteroidota bacterium]